NPNGPYEDSTVFDFMWEPTTKEDISRYLRINEKCEMRSNYEDRRAEFWKNIRITSKVYRSSCMYTGMSTQYLVLVC
ncbi:hypothetical protein ANCDUO_09699, partial [Ancylostoma duodenale]